MLKRIEEARAEGLDVTADQYPWTASSNALDASLPGWVREGGAREDGGAPARPGDARPRPRGIPRGRPTGLWTGGRARILITSVLDPALKKYEGKTIADIAKAEGKDPLDALMDIVIADKGNTARSTSP